MRRIRAWSLVTVLGAVNAGCAYNRPIPEAPLAVAGGPEAPLTERWLLRAGRGMSLPIVVHQGRLDGVGIDRRVVAVDLAEGSLRWAYRLDGPALSGVLLHYDTLISASERPDRNSLASDRNPEQRSSYRNCRQCPKIVAPVSVQHEARRSWQISEMTQL